MDPTAWWLFLVTETALCLVPGPAVLFVVAHGLGGGARPAVAANLGVLSGNAVYFLLSALGLGAVILASNGVFTAIKWLGAGYLVWLGVRAILGRFPMVAVRAADRRQLVRVYQGGLLLQLANPKSLLFFAALLPQFIDPSGSLALQVAILGVTSVAVEFAVLLLYGTGAGRASRAAREPRFARWTERIAGSLLIGAGLGLAAVRRAG